MNQIHVDMCSADCIDFYPTNCVSDFRIVLDESLVLGSELWCVALVGLTVECPRDGSELRGRELYLCSNVIDYSVVGGKKVHLLRKLCLGNGVRTARGGSMFSIDTVENACFYKRVNSQEIKHISIYVTGRKGERVEVLNECTVGVALHFK